MYETTLISLSLNFTDMTIKLDEFLHIAIYFDQMAIHTHAFINHKRIFFVQI